MITQKQIEDFKKYEAVRESGVANMFSVEAQRATGMNMADYAFVMANYVKLKREALSSDNGASK